MSAAPITVYMRLRPSQKVASEIVLDPNMTQMVIHNTVLPGAATLNFTYNGVFANASQEDMFGVAGKPAVDSALEGFNSTVLAYGQTSAGKSHTLIGDHSFSYKSRGVLPRMIEYLFAQLQARVGSTVEMQLSALEIFNERLVDLLAPSDGAGAGAGSAAGPPLSISDNDAAVSVKNLSVHAVDSVDRAFELMFAAENVRSIAESSLNMLSSRAHCIYTLYIRQRSRLDDTSPVLVTKINVVDLAGSERATPGTSLDATGSFINKSLTFLEQVVICLNANAAHIPYRQSKLTHILRDSIGGNCKTTLVSCIRPEREFLLDTISTARFSQRASFVKNISSINMLNRFYDSSAQGGAPGAPGAPGLQQRDLNSIIATAVAEALDAKAGDAGRDGAGPVLSKIIRELEAENKGLKMENLMLASGAARLAETDAGRAKLEGQLETWIAGAGRFPADLVSREDFVYALQYMKTRVGCGGGPENAFPAGSGGGTASPAGSAGPTAAAVAAPAPDTAAQSRPLSGDKKGKAGASRTTSPAKTRPEVPKVLGTVQSGTLVSFGTAGPEALADTLRDLNAWHTRSSFVATAPAASGAGAAAAAIATTSPAGRDSRAALTAADARQTPLLASPEAPTPASQHDAPSAPEDDALFSAFLQTAQGAAASKAVSDAKGRLEGKKAELVGLHDRLQTVKTEMGRLRGQITEMVGGSTAAVGGDAPDAAAQSNIINYKARADQTERLAKIRELGRELETQQQAFEAAHQQYTEAVQVYDQLRLAESVSRQKLLLAYERHCADLANGGADAGASIAEDARRSSGEEQRASGVFNSAAKRVGIRRTIK